MSSSQSQNPSQKAVLICGLGLLGQHCAVLLKELGIPVFGLHDVEPGAWQIEGTPDALDRFTTGDCRRHAALERAGIASCRAVVFTTSDERTNVSGALAARSLDPGIRLVIRSSQANLNERLNESLGNLMALDIAELPATAFALAAITDETVGLLSLDGRFLRVAEIHVTATDHWMEGCRLHDLNTRWRRVLHHSPAGSRRPIDFHGWDPRETVQPGDTLAYIEFYEPTHVPGAGPSGQSITPPAAVSRESLRSRLHRLWTGMSPTRRVATLTACALLVLHAAGVLLYKLNYPEVSLLDAFNVATVLIFDGYSNMFAQLKLPFPISLGMLLFSLLMTMSGAVVMGMAYAFITARVLSARLEFRSRPVRIPHTDHVIVIGAGPLARRVAELLSKLSRPVVVVASEETGTSLSPTIPVVTGDPRHCLAKANCAGAASVVALTDDDVTNLELALMSAQMNNRCELVIRTDDAEFARNVTSLAPRTQAMSIYALSAEAFAAVGLGERVLNLLRIGPETVLTTEFTIEPGDTFEGRVLAEVTCGFGLVAILHRRGPAVAEFFPSEDIRLEAGDRLVVLATIVGLQNAEHGLTAGRNTRVRILSVQSDEAVFEGARTISRVTGCHMGAASALLAEVPATIRQDLFRHQAQRLVCELGVIGVTAEVLRAAQSLHGADPR